MPDPGHVAISEVLAVHAELAVPAGSDILRYMPQTEPFVGWNYSSSETAAEASITGVTLALLQSRLTRMIYKKGGHLLQ